MSTTDAVTDSTDWLNTPLSALAPIENSLRCQVCKDFFTTPMITSCSHTFCSLCIRRYLSQEGRCPACRESDQEIKLRRNWIVEELVSQFQAGRDSIFKYAQSSQSIDSGRPNKRRKLENSVEPERRSTRSQSRRMPEVNGHQPKTVEEVEDSDEGSEYEEKSTTPHQTQPEDGLVACPICNKRMKEAHINRHLDSNCQDIPGSDSPRRSNTPQMKPLVYSQGKSVVREKLPTLNYSMFSEAALRKKLRELGIANHGSKELMRKRHIEWVNLWNASCDAQNPASASQLRKDLDQWERTLGRQIDRGPSGVMVKDFDRDGWQKSNKNDFDDLIRQARERAAAKKLNAVDEAKSDDTLPSETIDSQQPKTFRAVFSESIPMGEQYEGIQKSSHAASANHVQTEVNGTNDHDILNAGNEMYRQTD